MLWDHGGTWSVHFPCGWLLLRLLVGATVDLQGTSWVARQSLVKGGDLEVGFRHAGHVREVGVVDAGP